MFIALPIGFFIIAFLLFLTTSERFRRAFLLAAIAWGVVLLFLTELLSALNIFTRGGIFTGWLVAVAAGGIWLWSTGRLSQQWRKLMKSSLGQLRHGFPSVPCGLIAGCSLILVGVGVIALMYSPSTPDVMLYHMPRVVSWLDHQNVDFYPTHYLPQLSLPPWAEYAMAHLFALASGDRFVNMVQWFSLFGCGLGVSRIAELLGAPARGQILAATVCLTIPEGILQASTADNDYVVAFWLVCCVALLLEFRERPDKWTAIMVGLAGGLAFLTKATAYVYLPFILLALFLSSPPKVRIQLLRLAPLGIVAVLSLNLQQWVRNYDLCEAFPGCPFGDADKTFIFANERFGGAIAASNIVRNIALHIGTPSEEVNAWLTRLAAATVHAFGINPNDPGNTWLGTRFAIPKFNLHEDVMGNAIHLLLILATLILLTVDFKRQRAEVLAYAAGLTMAFILFCAYLKWQPWHTRLHLPLFVLWSAATGTIFAQKLKPSWMAGLGTVLLMCSAPPVFDSTMRPLLMIPEGVPWTAHRLHYGAPPSFSVIADLADRNSCRHVGIDAGKNFSEYPLLKYLRAGFGERKIWRIGVNNLTSKYAANVPQVKPECVACVDCPQNGDKWHSYQAAGMRAVALQDVTFFYDLPATGMK